MDLPHEVVPAFMTTLEHIKTADLILPVRDISHPQTEEMNKTVQDVLITLGLDTILKDQNKFIGSFYWEYLFTLERLFWLFGVFSLIYTGY